MAKVEHLSYDDGDTVEVINVHWKVGNYQYNIYDDVLVVQALLKYYREWRISLSNDFAPKFLTGEPSGIVDGSLSEYIRAYQLDVNKRERRIAVTADGVAGPAKGKISYRSGRYWTIYYLNYDCTWASYEQTGSSDHISTLKRRFPQLIGVLGF